MVSVEWRRRPSAQPGYTGAHGMKGDAKPLRVRHPSHDERTGLNKPSVGSSSVRLLRGPHAGIWPLKVAQGKERNAQIGMSHDSIHAAYWPGSTWSAA